ncbi:hypothetical protein GCM10008018_33610 [Paenibacillus marchantiophytorum]|uniref:Uncharacterized protein n=1 Tax=Paenibacillus marchantiophytorum TaxID=1619310 RepID=A0ABQ1ESP4_9BACL|nr:hypothetical protein [Paenibacillus marchantiophytorum]GFZ84894.1 hypothetical protein GCM10008018_33610 [Paenibacillus marchantiophytorum]
MVNQAYTEFKSLSSSEAEAAFQNDVQSEGYSGFRRLLDGLTEAIKTALDADMAEIESAVSKGRSLFPEPVQFSPSWEYVWAELEATIAAKRHALTAIAPADRTGEWQVIMDNPNAVQEVVCYPGLDFLDAAYLYAYFRPQLEKSEYIRLQKIQTVIQDVGS